MLTAFQDVIYFALPLIIVGVLVKYIFKSNINFLMPSAILLLLFILITICAPYTSKKYDSELFALTCFLHVVALVGAFLFMSKQEMVWKHFFISLIFQLFYGMTLFYYGGLLLTHKFEV